MKHFSAVTVVGELFFYDDVDRPIVRITQTGVEYCNFEVRVNRYDRDGEPTGKQSRHRCTAWAAHAQKAAAFRCGDTVMVGGELTRSQNPKTEEWRDEIKASSVVLVDPDGADRSAPAEPVKFPDVSEIVNLDVEDDYI